MKFPEKLPQVMEDDSIDLVALLKQIYSERKLILFATIGAALLGVIVALATSNTYTSGSTFIPQTGGESKPSSGLSGLASLAGINLGGVSVGSDIPPTLYPQIISSVPYRLELLEQTLNVNSKEVTLKDYLLDNTGSSVLGVVKKYTIGLPWLILESLKNSNARSTSKSSVNDFREIGEEDFKLFVLLNNKLKLQLNDKTGVVGISFSDKNKYITAQVAERAKELLQERIIAFKNQSARELLDFTTKQYQDNKTSYEVLQDSIAIFKDQNLNISSSLYQNRLDRLVRELNIASSVVEQLATQLEQAKLQVNKDTPVFTVIEPVTIPFERSAPKRSLIVIIWTFLGAVLSTGFVLIREPASEIFQSIKKGEA